jgi:TatD DNase family protein
MLIDTHCHLGDAAFAAEAEAVVARARAAGVAHIVTVGESPGAADRALGLARRLAGVSATAGMHPHQASAWGPASAEWLAGMLAEPEVVAAGEMGLDYHYDHSPRQVQRRVLDEQLALAAAAGKPAVIHAREADADLAAILQNHPTARIVLHSFSSGPVLLGAGLALDCYVSFSGMITFQSWTSDDLIRQVPHERLLVETDAPYLAPVPHRGRRNEPAFVARVAERLAEVIGLTLPETIALTGANAVRFFGSRLTSDQELP